MDATVCISDYGCVIVIADGYNGYYYDFTFSIFWFGMAAVVHFYS